MDNTLSNKNLINLGFDVLFIRKSALNKEIGHVPEFLESLYFKDRKGKFNPSKIWIKEATKVKNSLSKEFLHEFYIIKNGGSTYFAIVSFEDEVCVKVKTISDIRHYSIDKFYKILLCKTCSSSLYQDSNKKNFCPICNPPF